ncbi:MAG: flagellar filament capping protein FliD [Myxococcota bacterium]
MAASFRASGLASGLDTATLIEGLVKLEARPIDLVKGRQKAAEAQLSALGDLISKLQALQSAARALGDHGPLALKATTSATGFTAVAAPGAQAGTYDISVGTLAVAAKARSQTFASATSAVTGGTLTLGVQGQSYNITISDGAALSDVATAINASGAPISATVLTTSNGAVLSLVNRNTGHPVGQDPSTALTISEVSTGMAGQSLGLSVTQPAVNATFQIDGMPFERTTNEVTDALPNVTLSLKKGGTAAEPLSLAQDVEGTAQSLQKFVDAYNAVAKLVHTAMNTTASTNRGTTLAGDAGVRSVQRHLHKLVSGDVAGLTGTVRALADLGIETARDGTISLDRATLEKALARDPDGVTRVFTQGSTGVGDAVDALVDVFTASGDGVLVSARKSMQDRIAQLQDDVERMQLRVDQFQENLVRQFAAMEKVVSGLRSISDFLVNQSNQENKS